jgi:hypothetical protein
MKAIDLPQSWFDSGAGARGEAGSGRGGGRLAKVPIRKHRPKFGKDARPSEWLSAKYGQLRNMGNCERPWVIDSSLLSVVLALEVKRSLDEAVGDLPKFCFLLDICRTASLAGSSHLLQ